MRELPDGVRINFLSPADVVAISETLGGAARCYISINWNRWADATRRLYLRSFTNLQKFHLDDQKLATMIPLDAEMALDQLPPGMRQQTLIFIRTVSAFAYKNGAIAKDHFAGAVFDRGKERGWDAWTVEELERIPKDEQVGAAIHLAAITGQRLADILWLNTSMFDMKNNVLTISQMKTGNLVRLPITTEMCDIPVVRRKVIINAKQNYRLFPSMGEARFKFEYYKLVKLHGIKKPFHGLRKLCAARMAEAGCTMPEIMAVTGHKSTTTAMKYLKSADKYILAKRAMDRVKKMEEELNEV